MHRPLLAITMGDPAGVGPETIAGVWRSPELHARCRLLVIGHPEILRRAAALRGLAAEVVEVLRPDEAPPSPALLPCLAACSDKAVEAPAVVDARAGEAAYEALVAAARLALAGHVDGIVTAPLHKAALWRAGHEYPGHTELLAELCGVDDFAMMLFLAREGPPAPSTPNDSPPRLAGLGVVHVTLHMALRQVFASLSEEAILVKTRLVDKVMRDLTGGRPRIGVAALNPHAGEEGLFGDEETRLIGPAVEQARRAGFDVRGPLPADTLFVRARDGDFDAVVAMYHDQGHIALKLMGMHRAVNVTLGLPIVRTSVAHGTAFDLSWQGLAETTGLVEAIRVAATLAGVRNAECGVRNAK